MRFLKSLFPAKPSPYKQLAKKWSARHASAKEKLWSKHKEQLDWLVKNIPAKHHLAAGSLSGLLMLTPPLASALPSPSIHPEEQKPLTIPKHTFLLTDIKAFLPDEVRPLTPEEEEKITSLLSDYFHFPVKAELEGKRLNRNYGIIGAEQHLMLYPGDTIATHFQTSEEANNFSRFGMAPGRGAWGYFAPSKAELTQKDIDREKYYIAVQTFLAPGFSERVREYYEFFKYRKMLVVNPQNGKAMVVVIGDAGPAVWTGKHLGGSPEVMKYLERIDGRHRGPVLYFFIDDPEDTIPLGPLEV